jgi:hypothetical protein
MGIVNTQFHLINDSQPPSDNKSKNENSEPYKCPFIFMRWALFMMQAMAPYFTQSFKDKFLPSFRLVKQASIKIIFRPSGTEFVIWV